MKKKRWKIRKNVLKKHKMYYIEQNVAVMLSGVNREVFSHV